MFKNKIKLKSVGKAGFTLIEVVLVSAIIGIVALAAYQTLSIGLKVWEKTRTYSVEEDVLLFFDRISMDLRNAFDFSLFEFSGKPEKIQFTTIVRVPMARSGSREVSYYVDQIGQVKYGYEAAGKGIFRQQASYGQALDGKFSRGRVLVRPVKRVRFEYLKRQDNALVAQQLNRDRLPDVIRVSVDYEDDRGDRQKLTRLINLPMFL